MQQDTENVHYLELPQFERDRKKVKVDGLKKYFV